MSLILPHPTTVMIDVFITIPLILLILWVTIDYVFSVSRRISCLKGHCTDCKTYATEDGIGGKCVHCGRIHGWITRKEIQKYFGLPTNFKG